jgi:ferrochelatase
VATARLIGDKLGAEERRIVCFQSRPGARRIRPFTDHEVRDAAARGVKAWIVVPSFVADRLETLEEIGMRAVDD